VEGRLVVTHVGPKVTEVKRGDVIRMVDGQSAADVLRDREQRISGATPQWKRYRAVQSILAGKKDSEMKLNVQTGSQKPRQVTLRRTRRMMELVEPRPPAIHEVKPGVMYVDLDRITTKQFEEAVPRLAKARGIIFDLRGYPSRVTTAPLAHLTDKPVSSARWNVPVVMAPDRQG